MKTDYSLADIMNDGLIVLSSQEYGNQVWGKCVTRKFTHCFLCRAEVKSGSEVFRPITNLNNRMERICASCLVPIIEAVQANESARESKPE